MKSMFLRLYKLKKPWQSMGRDGTVREWSDVTLSAIIPAVFALLLTGCGTLSMIGIGVDDPSTLRGSVSAAEDINPNGQGKASPVAIHLFELRDTAAFNSADFFALYEHHDKVLGADLVRAEKFVLTPGEARPIDYTLDLETRHIAVVAAFRDWENATWRASAHSPVDESIDVSIEVSRVGVSIDIDY